jgi:2-dehydro-3-deoxyphosphogluconate aldolase/(4S)-4-hydroxy-2-oxoglutarate aldolase
MNISRFKQNPFMAILRGIQFAQVAPLVETVIAAGWETLEIAMNTPDAPTLIREAARLSKDRLMIGAGTVLSLDSLRAALRSGASFIVMPTLEEEIARVCVAEGIPVFPGALTPREVWNAWRAGATMVKVFPAKVFGPEYFKELKGPLDSVELLACSGVTPDNLKAYHACGASAFAVGAGVFKKAWLETGDYDRIQTALRAYRTVFAEMG